MNSFPVRYKSKDCDLAGFLNHHPGGINYLKSYKNNEISQKMCDIGHSKSAYYMLNDYKLEKREDQISEDDGNLEHLIDWNKPIFWQVGSLGRKYEEWVTSPVNRKMRLFENAFVERASVTPWYVIPLLWLPIATIYLYIGCKTYIERSSPDSQIVFPIFLYAVFGVGVWTLSEYIIHRWLLHFMPDGSSKLMLHIHFILHGVHHKVPYDSRGQVFPPVYAFILVYIFHNTFVFMWSRQAAFIMLGAFLLGYVTFDMIHYYSHNGKPDGGYLYYLKRYHLQHHFSHHHSGFGVSSPAWDLFFGSVINLRNLSMKIKWSKEHQL